MIGRIEYVFFEKDKRNGITNPGTSIEPITYQSFTTEGIIKANAKAIKPVTVKPFRTKWIVLCSDSSFNLDVDWILHKISRPKVIAFINPKESIVDMMVASRPVIKKPYAKKVK